ncbi:MAG TPA: 1-(5-phosphoribosyl)-5-((5-phosphoribosylamino)methylideneamino)imidazole-4-carboxamide isomerase [Actinobacteria bacterium]|nr:1-(5-phosphoribosyl)-5-((5-phosphoribosylamino)methylideneamino)imidazole-4-carboxamide isomerase [Actinomycetota bacterium]
MEVIPAIDVLGGRVVRLERGDFERVTAYGDDPAATAERWVSAGATTLHLVVLDAARSGTPDHDLLRRVARRRGDAALQVGGGIRDGAAATAAVAAGADRVVVGSALLDETRFPEIVAAVGADRIVAAVDVRDGRVRGSGWLDEGRALGEVLDRVRGWSLRRVLVTGIDRDGLLAGPDFELLERVREALPDAELVAGGGVGSIDDLVALAEAGCAAAVVGRALYEGRFGLTEAIAAVG